jgi:hypothetical protein
MDMKNLARGSMVGWVMGWLFATLWFLSATSWAQRSSTVDSGYLAIESAHEVIQKWSPETHLYVKGDLGVSPAQLRELEQWLEKEGPHWTIVLMNEAAGEYFVAADGRSYFGIDAVEHASE